MCSALALTTALEARHAAYSFLCFVSCVFPRSWLQCKTESVAATVRFSIRERTGLLLAFGCITKLKTLDAVRLGTEESGGKGEGRGEGGPRKTRMGYKREKEQERMYGEEEWDKKKKHYKFRKTG